MSFWSGLRVSWQAYKTRRKMNRQFGKRPDPFGYTNTPYEAARLEGHYTREVLARLVAAGGVDIEKTPPEDEPA